MSKLIVRIQPVVFNYFGAIVDDNGNSSDIRVSTNNHDIAVTALQHDVDTIILVGNPKYSKKIKESIENSLEQINQKNNYTAKMNIILQENK